MIIDLESHLLPTEAYFAALAERIPRAQRRIVIHAMDIRWDANTEPLLSLLQDAAHRGVEVRLVGDMYTKFETQLRYLTRPHYPTWKYITQRNNQLRTAGVHVTYTSKLGLNPFSGRTHSKVTILDDRIYTFGGINLTGDAFDFRDYMLEMNDSQLANRLYELVRLIEKDSPGPLPELQETISPTATLLFDGGTPRVSTIYDVACTAVKDARKVYYMSQMCPSGRLAKLINTIDNECYFVRPTQTDLHAGAAIALDQFRFKIRNRYTGSNYLHAKFILTEGRDGSRHIISGSHNFSWRGVAYGTREIALHSIDPLLWDTFYKFLRAETL